MKDFEDLATIELVRRELGDGDTRVLTLLDGVEIPDANVSVEMHLDGPNRVYINGMEINGAMVYRNGELLCAVPRHEW